MTTQVQGVTREVSGVMVGITGTKSITGRVGRPLVYSVTETVVFVLIAAALIASAAVPAMVRNPHAAQARTLASAGVRP